MNIYPTLCIPVAILAGWLLPAIYWFVDERVPVLGRAKGWRQLSVLAFGSVAALAAMLATIAVVHGACLEMGNCWILLPVLFSETAAFLLSNRYWRKRLEVPDWI